MFSLPCLAMQLTWERIAKLEASRDLKSLASNFLRGRGTGEHNLCSSLSGHALCRFQHHELSLQRHVALIVSPISVDIQPANDLSVHCCPLHLNKAQVCPSLQKSPCACVPSG